ncbi:uncharacterized protein LOC121388655 isoform X2 [Gigantopelta aegis]|uniref:uncharacterized protein LOC121388655 isoform X2 n=1 Tax=Gigantopelta aegis TaxID=1735272 RepID=UPI001B889D43|nr:uncharacterized protein LOC121388655 isoform X2 [Gigantopelta aegis]
MPGGNQKKSKKQRDNPTKTQKEEAGGSLSQTADHIKTKLDQTCRHLDMLFKQNALETAKLGPRPELMGLTPLSVAAKVNYIDAVIRLLAANADVNEQSSDGGTALMQATIGKFYNTMEILLKRGADPSIANSEGNNAFMVAVTTGDAKVLNGIWPYRRNLDINYANEIGYTALHLAAELRWESCIQFLLLNGADVNKRCKKGCSPLFIAVVNDDIKSVERLTANHCNILLEDENSYTAICRAVDLEKHEIGNFLLRKLSTPERDYFVKTRIEKLRANFSEDLANGIVFHVLIAAHAELKDTYYKFKLVPNLIQMSQRHIEDTECVGWVMALCYMVMYDPDTFVEERFVVQFMRAHGQELVLKALKYCDEREHLGVSIEHVARIFLPFVALSETKEGEQWLEKNWLSVARYTEFLKTNSGIESVDECCSFHGREMWNRFSAYFEGIQNKYHKQNAAELLEEETRRQEQQQKKKEKKRQKRQKQKEWKTTGGASDSDIMAECYAPQEQRSEPVLLHASQDYHGDMGVEKQHVGNRDAGGIMPCNDGGVEVKMRDTSCHSEYIHVPDPAVVAVSQEREPAHQSNFSFTAEENSSSWITVESKKSVQVKVTGSKTAKGFGSLEKNNGKKRNGQGKKKSSQKSSPVKLHSNMKWSDVAKGNIIPNNQTWGQASVYVEMKPENDTAIPDYEQEFPSLHGKDKSDAGYVLTSFESMTDVASESVCSGMTVDFENELDQETENWEYERSAEENDGQQRADVCDSFTDANSGVYGIPMWADFTLKANPDYYIHQAQPPLPPPPPYCMPRAVDQVCFQKPVESLNSIANSLSRPQPMDSLNGPGQSVIYPKQVQVCNYKPNCSADVKSQTQIITNRDLFSKATYCHSVAELEALMKEEISNPNVDVQGSLSNSSVQEYLKRCENSRKGTCNKEQDQNNMVSFLSKVIGGSTDLDGGRSDKILFPADLRDDDHSEKGDSSKDDLLPYPETRELFPGFYDCNDSVVGKGVLALSLEDLAKQQVLEHYKYLAGNDSLKDNVYFHDFYYYASLYGLTMEDLEKYASTKNGKTEDLQDEIAPAPSGSHYSQAELEEFQPRQLCSLSKDALEKAKDDIAPKDDVDSSDANAVVQGNRPSSPHKLAEAKWSARSRRWKDKLRKILELPMTMRTQYSKIVIPIRTQDFNINPNGNPVVLGFLTDGSEVAVKVMDGTRMTVNKEVVKQLAQSDMNFNFLLRYKALAEVGSRHFLAMELCDYTLQEYIKIVHLDHKHDPLSVNRLAWQLLKGIKYLHDDIGIVHGNLKPDNIFVDSEGKLRVGGYGIVAKDRMCRFSLGQSQKGGSRCWQATEMLMENDEDAVPTMTSDIQVVGMLVFML